MDIRDVPQDRATVAGTAFQVRFVGDVEQRAAEVALLVNFLEVTADAAAMTLTTLRRIAADRVRVNAALSMRGDGMKHALAYNSIGILGLVTSDGPRPTRHRDESVTLSWRGLAVAPGTDHGRAVEPGDPWNARTPGVIARLSEVDALALYAILLTAVVRRRIADADRAKAAPLAGDA